MKARPSFLPLLAQCPMAGDTPAGINSDPNNEYVADIVLVGINARYQGRLGQAFHGIMKTSVDSNTAPSGGLTDAAAIEYTVEFRELWVLVQDGWNWWQQIREHHPSPITEKKMSHGILEGTPDLVSIVGEEGRGIDYKSGFVLRDHTEQVEAYIWLTFQEFPQLKRCRWLVMNIRTGRLIPFNRTREDSDRWYARTVEYLTERRYVTNDDCDSCPRCLSCPALKGWIATAAESIGITLVNHDAGEDVDLFESFETAKFLGRLAERFETATKARLKAGGPVKLKKKALQMVEEKREHLISDVVVRVLLRDYGVTPELLCHNLSFSKSSLYPVLCQLADAGGEKRKPFVEEFYNRLRQENGLEISSSWSAEVEHFDVEPQAIA